MNKLLIHGGRALLGEVKVQGCKNSVLPILAATLLCDKECIIHNCPDISDTDSAFEILKELGGNVRRENSTVYVKTQNIACGNIPRDLMQKMRSSVMFLGAVLARCGYARISKPGGCRLGERPIDIHLCSLKDLGAEILEENDEIYCRLNSVKSRNITLLYPSVGATENIILMCALSKAEVVIYNPAREPEIVDLQNFLNLMGADIKGAGTDVIRICGRDKLSGCEYTIMPDRIAAATYCFGAAACGGKVCLKNTEMAHMRTTLGALEATGVEIKAFDNEIILKANNRLKAIDMVKTLPYPGFATDVQPMMAAALTTADGTSGITETIFENRYMYVPYLKNMGADIDIRENSITIKGVKNLHGEKVSASDLRSGAALVIAGAKAEGETEIFGYEYIKRGYQDIALDFKSMGADIVLL